MFSRLHFSFLFVLFVILALLVFWMDYVVGSPATAQDKDLFNHPDYIVEELSGIQINHESEVLRTFSAKEMLHFLDEKITYLKDPYFTSTTPKKPVMQIKAKQAELLENGENIHLTENVMVLRGVDEDEDNMTMVTNYLHLIPDEDVAKTDRNVSITTDNLTLQAVGLELNNRTGILEFMSQVKVLEN